MKSPILSAVLVLSAGQAPTLPPTLKDLERELEAPKPETRRAAVQKLAALCDRRAWEFVLRALGDSESMVADEAEVALGAITDPKLVGELLGGAGLKSRDAWVRLRAAEALGRMRMPFDGELLARALASTEPSEIELRRMLLWSIERLAASKRVEGDRAKTYRTVETIAASRADPELRGAALEATSALDGLEAHALVIQSLADRAEALRCAALLAISTYPEQECLTLSERGLDDPEFCVRAQAIENLEKLSSRAAILALVHQMEIEKRERLRVGILAWLRARSGLDLGFDAAAWRQWAQKVEGRLATGSNGGVRLAPLGATKASFAGLNLISDRVCL